MKDYLMKLIKAKETRAAEIRELVKNSEDITEVRALGVELESVNAELNEAKTQLANLEAEEQRSAMQNAETPDGVPANATHVNGNVRGSFTTGESRANVNPLESMEYRQAFMAYVQSGTAIPAEFRSGDAISTNETGAAIPMTIMNEVINTVRKRYGNLYSKVRKISVQGGVKIPIGSLEASFKWISESTVSPRQSLDKLGSVTFGYHTAEIRIAQTFLSQIVTLSAFEAKITEVIALAYLKAMDYGIVNGSGDGSMLGILNDPRVTNTITMTAAQINDWKAWRKNFFSALPLGYRNGEFIFPLSTVESYLETMSDANNNPIFRQATGLEVNDGDAVNPNGRFFGRDISLVEPNIIADFDTASAGDVIGVFWQPEEYAINENFGFTMRRYFDEETNEWVDKALTVVDGKVLNPTGFYKIIKG